MNHLADPDDPTLAALYADVPPAQMERYQAFCRAYPYKQASINGVEWSYIDGHESGQAILLLSGAMAIPDISWMTIDHFAQTNRVIAPAYPAVKTMAALTDGIAEIMHREGFEQAHVVGGSYGGFVAQVFVRRHPELTRSLVLSHTLPPDPVNLQSFKNSIRGLKLLPQGVLRQLMDKRLGTLITSSAEETALLRAMYDEVLYRRLSKADILSSLWRTVDYYAQVFTPQDLDTWQGGVLLVMADDDPGTPEPVRSALINLYPGAKLHLFHGTGHLSSVLKEKEYQMVIQNFLDEAE